MSSYPVARIPCAHCSEPHDGYASDDYCSNQCLEEANTHWYSEHVGLTTLFGPGEVTYILRAYGATSEFCVREDDDAATKMWAKLAIQQLKASENKDSPKRAKKGKTNGTQR